MNRRGDGKGRRLDDPDCRVGSHRAVIKKHGHAQLVSLETSNIQAKYTVDESVLLLF